MLWSYPSQSKDLDLEFVDCRSTNYQIDCWCKQTEKEFSQKGILIPKVWSFPAIDKEGMKIQIISKLRQVLPGWGSQERCQVYLCGHLHTSNIIHHHSNGFCAISWLRKPSLVLGGSASLSPRMLEARSEDWMPMYLRGCTWLIYCLSSNSWVLPIVQSLRWNWFQIS